eukprot:gene3685-4605_t
MSILYVRAHIWISTPFQLVFWEALLAAVTLSTLALCIDGAPRIVWTPGLASAFLYAGVIGTALGYWAMAMVSRSVPAVTASLGVLATPVIGVAVSAIARSRATWMRAMAGNWLAGNRPQWPSAISCCCRAQAGAGRRASSVVSCMAPREPAR